MIDFNDIPTVSFHRKNKLLVAVIVILALGNIVLGIGYIRQLEELKNLHQQQATQKTNQQVVNFLNLFIQKVLKTDKEISFEDRLLLENAIRDINDHEILAKWEQFTSGTNIDQIQRGVKDLLESLGKKIY